ncbi:sensor of ECF-type sigma factor [Flavobacteriaceae bacterium SZ-1-7]|uniref:sensor of ECF-type sigma factor n=1 Tax=Tamlana sedimenti TaxID=3134126 RepID=UPI003124C11A
MKKIILPILMFLVSLSTFAQDKRDQIKAQKVAFITERLSLTESEAQQFWPIYNAYDDVTHKLRHEDIKNMRREIKDNINTLSNERASQLLSDMAAAESQLCEEEAKLNNKLKKIISPKKIIMLKIAEEDFKKKLFEQWKKMRRDRPKP